MRTHDLYAAVVRIRFCAVCAQAGAFALLTAQRISLLLKLSDVQDSRLS